MGIGDILALIIVACIVIPILIVIFSKTPSKTQIQNTGDNCNNKQL
jgi:hypothetical protein